MLNFDKSRIIFVLLLMALLFASFILDEFIASFLSPLGIRFFIVQTLFFTCSLSVPFPIMLLFAFFTGLTWDSIHMAIDIGDDVGFGYSIFLFFVTGALMQGMSPFFSRGRWEAPVVLVGVSTALFFLMEWFFISFARANFIFPDNYWKQLWVSVFFGMVFSPFFFYLILRLSKLCGNSIIIGEEAKA
ncbi:MAG: hypothetical protein CMO46_12305 [Verrucomicrobiales bacterium]|nr:hypothetical protein [Verrucomicrobiales bacterium]